MHLVNRHLAWLLMPVMAVAIFMANAGTVAAAGSPTVTTTTLPGGNAGVAYTATLAATGGTAPYTWSVSAGALPDGLALSAAGDISGTPTKEGSFAFTVTVTDSAAATATADLSIKVAPAKQPPSDDELAARVQAACDKHAGEEPYTALCDVFAKVKLPAFAREAIGHVILRLDAGKTTGKDDKDEDKDGDHDSKGHDQDNDRAGHKHPKHNHKPQPGTKPQKSD